MSIVKRAFSFGGEQKAYQHGAGGYDAVHHGSAVQKHGYGEQKAYQHGSDAGGYGSAHHDSATQKHGYGGGQKAYAHGADAGGQKKHGYGGQMAYQHGADAGGYGGGVQKHGTPDGTTLSTGQKKHGGYVSGYDALVQRREIEKQQRYNQGCESHEESEEESDCEEELGHAESAGGVHKYYSAPGGTEYYSAYKRRQTQGYSGGGGYGGWRAQPKNHSYY